MSVSIKYTLEDFDKGKIKDKFGMQDNGKADLFLANTCFKRMVKYTPWDTGTMATTVTIKPKKIIYEQEYAIYQYRGYTKGPVKHYSNNASRIRGKNWADRMFNNEKDKVAKEVSDYIKLIEKE